MKWPTGCFPQLQSCVSLVESVTLVLLFRSIVPRMARPALPPSCKGAAKELQANNKNTETNIIELFILLTHILAMSDAEADLGHFRSSYCLLFFDLLEDNGPISKLVHDDLVSR
jgi:hypothetical protein